MTTKHEWERLEGETKNSYCWFQEYLNHPDYSIKNFYEKVEKDSKSSTKSKKGLKTPTFKTVYKWSGCNNWIKRKEAYNIYKSEQQRHRLEEASFKDMEEIYALKTKLIRKGLEKAVEELESDNPSGYHYSNYVNGATKLLDDNRIDTGRATEISKSEVSAVVDASVESVSVFDEIGLLEQQLSELKEQDKDAD